MVGINFSSRPISETSFSLSQPTHSLSHCLSLSFSHRPTHSLTHYLSFSLSHPPMPSLPLPPPFAVPPLGPAPLSSLPLSAILAQPQRHIRIYTQTYIHTHIRIYTGIYTHTHIRIHILTHRSIYTHILIYAYIYICVFLLAVGGSLFMGVAGLWLTIDYRSAIADG